ncbi:hypothetical protein [Flavobacterium sp. GCM10023249]|uniref:hypothetical protein n=1 Tax=unclassified Flavobacterium TaxID=196869 RepID=UPI003621F969
MKHLIFYILILIFLSSCEVDNNKLFESLNKEFLEAIYKNKAKKFVYQVDGLVPQESFFINRKLKYLKYHHGPENGSIDYLIYFDLKTDSVSKIIRREVGFGNHDENYNDSIFVFSNNLKNHECFVGNKLTDSTPAIKKVEIDRTFIRAMKSETEKKYNGI